MEPVVGQLTIDPSIYLNAFVKDYLLVDQFVVSTLFLGTWYEMSIDWYDCGFVCLYVWLCTLINSHFSLSLSLSLSLALIWHLERSTISLDLLIRFFYSLFLLEFAFEFFVIIFIINHQLITLFRPNIQSLALHSIQVEAFHLRYKAEAICYPKSNRYLIDPEVVVVEAAVASMWHLHSTCFDITIIIYNSIEYKPIAH